MGYAVLHLDKAHGADTKMSDHIERKTIPNNARLNFLCLPFGIVPQ